MVQTYCHGSALVSLYAGLTEGIIIDLFPRTTYSFDFLWTIKRTYLFNLAHVQSFSHTPKTQACNLCSLCNANCYPMPPQLTYPIFAPSKSFAPSATPIVIPCPHNSPIQYLLPQKGHVSRQQEFDGVRGMHERAKNEYHYVFVDKSTSTSTVQARVPETI